MFLVWLLCVTLVLAALVARRELRALIQDWKLRLFGVRVRVRHPAQLPVSARPVVRPFLHRLPPPRVDTRPGPE
jgi:hypothetical protein